MKYATTLAKTASSSERCVNVEMNTDSDDTTPNHFSVIVANPMSGTNVTR